jgi:hypothetical protein
MVTGIMLPRGTGETCIVRRKWCKCIAKKRNGGEEGSSLGKNGRHIATRKGNGVNCQKKGGACSHQKRMCSVLLREERVQVYCHKVKVESLVQEEKPWEVYCQNERVKSALPVGKKEKCVARRKDGRIGKCFTM